MTQFSFDAETIAQRIAEWVAIESPSYDAAAVNRIMDLAATTMAGLGAEITRFPGQDGFGDLVKARLDEPVRSVATTTVPATIASCVRTGQRRE